MSILLVWVGQDVLCGVGCVVLVVACGSVGRVGYGCDVYGDGFGQGLRVMLECGVWGMRDCMCRWVV